MADRAAAIDQAVKLGGVVVQPPKRETGFGVVVQPPKRETGFGREPEPVPSELSPAYAPLDWEE